MAEKTARVTQRSLFYWVLGYHRGWQLVLLGLIVVAIFLRVFPLEMQKRIVDTAIALKKIDLLYRYCGLYLVAVVTAGLIKYLINILQSYLGQRILLKIRTQLYEHILQLPLTFYRKTPGGMVISSLTSELSAIGNFLGGALAVPVTNLMTLVAFAGYMFYLNPLLAVCSFSIYPLEIILVPILQTRFNRLNRDRVDTTRSMSNVIGEAVSGIQEIHGNAAFALEQERFGGFARSLYRLRHGMNITRFGIKFTNNLFQSLGPFILFLLGGYLTIHGRFDLGSLVAFLSAYEKLYDPWKELMDYYQSLQDSRVRYRRVMEYFDLPSDFAVVPVDRAPFDLQGRVEVDRVGYRLDDRTRLLENVSLTLELGRQLAIVGYSGSGKSTLAMILGQLIPYSTGRVTLDGHELRVLSKLDVAETIGFVPQFPFIFEGTLRENLLYGHRALNLEDARRADCMPEPEQVMAVAEQVGLKEDLIRLGLSSKLSPSAHGDLIERLVRIRRQFYQLWGKELRARVEFFSLSHYLRECDVYRNIVFGDPRQPVHQLDNVIVDPAFRQFLDHAALTKPLLDLGRALAIQTVELLGNLGDEDFFFEGSPIPGDQFESYRQLVFQLQQRPHKELAKKDTERLMTLALRFIPARHRMGVMPPDLEQRILSARQKFIREFGGMDTDCCLKCIRGTGPDSGPPKERRLNTELFSFYCPYEYLQQRNIQDNILFGLIRSDRPGAADTVQSLIMELLAEEGVLERIAELGMEFQVGSKGDRLSGGQKQKVSLARALIKKPSLLILDEATASLDHASQLRVQQILQRELKGRVTIVSVVHQLDWVKQYDQIAVLKAGKLVELGSFDALMAQQGVFYELARGK